MTRSSSLLRVLTYLALLCVFDHFHVSAQYIQEYEVHPVAVGGGTPVDKDFWRPSQGDALQQVIDLAPETVFLEYNCFYMKEICRNVEDFYASPRGQNHAPTTRFGYDLNTGKNQRAAKRREKSCPTGTNGWRTYHTCPETDQGIVMRHDGPWPHKDLEPGTVMNAIKNQRDPQGNVIEYSRLRYSCDEFPPATWVEGGSGVGVLGNGANPGDAITRCAAMRCGAGAKSEQDWQATAHLLLRYELMRRTTLQEEVAPGKFPNYNRNSVIFFRFRRINTSNGIAARIYSYADPSLTQQLFNSPKDIPQAKRSIDDEARYNRWADTVTIDELIASGNGTMHLIHANDTVSETSMGNGMRLPDLDLGFGFKGGLGQDIDLDKDGSCVDVDEDEDEDEVGDEEGLDHPFISKRSQRLKPRRLSESAITPLAKSATSSDIETARAVVEKAILESAKLNRARLANPFRNKYSLKPGTVVGGAGTSQRRGLDGGKENQDPPCLLDITDEIARAAALLSESDALQTAGNVTIRQAAEAGTFWMEHLERKGTVPWGDDPDYTVSFLLDLSTPSCGIVC